MIQFLFIATLFSWLFGRILISKNLFARLGQYANSFTFRVVSEAQSNSLSHFLRLGLCFSNSKNLELFFALSKL